MVSWLVSIGCQNENKITEQDVLSEDQVENEEEAPFSCDEILVTDEGAFLPQTGTVLANRSTCSVNWHASSGASNSSVSVTLEHWDGAEPAQMRIENLLGEPLIDWTVIENGQSLHLPLEQSGEFFIFLGATEELKIGEEYRIGVDCITGCDLEYTRYPLVFLHGLAGFDSLLNVMDYWIGVDDLLPERGYLVDIHNVPAFDTTYVRTEEWSIILAGLVDEGIGRRFNLIGHSQGGMDARYLASNLDPEHRIVSITTVSTPHQGTSVADALSGAINGLPFDGALIDAMFDMGSQLFGIEGENLSGQLEGMSIENMEVFNQETPDRADVQYFSWAGRSCRYFQFSCQNEQDGETVSSFFLLAHAYIEAEEGDNDGLVSVESAHWGEFLGVISADHMDEVGHRFDLSSQPFDSTEFYLSEARRLAAAGF